MEVNVVELVDRPEAGPTQAEFTQESSDPVTFFHLRENPFLDNVNPEFFFRTEAHEDAYLKMKKCIEDNIALGLISAQSGTGKTLLTQILLQELDKSRYRPALVLAYPRFSRSALLREVAQELSPTLHSSGNGAEIETLSPRLTLHALMNAVQERIYQLHKEGVKPVILIDEVHFLSGDTLHLLRTLSNIETAREKLVTILLFGEESFLEKLGDPRFKAILSRTFIRANLRPLFASEVEQYVKFRCLMAGGRGDIFTKETFARIHEQTGGVPREVNRLCHNTLARAAQKRIATISSELLDDVIRKGY
jgi:general secretion pathway protein A